MLRFMRSARPVGWMLGYHCSALSSQDECFLWGQLLLSPWPRMLLQTSGSLHVILETLALCFFLESLC